MNRKIIGATVGTPMNPQRVVEQTGVVEQIEKNTQDISDLSKMITGTMANAIINSASGESIDVTDSANAPLQSMKVFGKSWQNTNSGSNILPPNISINGTGLNITIDEQGQYVCSGTTKDESTVDLYVFGAWSGQTNDLGIRGNVTFCCDDSNLNIYVLHYDGSTTSAIGSGKGSVNLTITDDNYVTGLSCRFLRNTSYNKTIRIWANYGTTKLPFEPYVGGIASPNPNYPQDIHSNGESGSIEYGVYGANLFNAENPNFLLKATNISVRDNKVTFTTSDQYGQFGNDYRNLPSGTYTFGYESVDCSDVVEVRAYYGSNGTIGTQIARTTSGKSITFEYDSTQGDLIVWTRPNVATTITYTGLCFCVGDTLKSEPYKAMQSLLVQTPNGLNGIPVSSGGNYTDENGQQWICDEIDFERGKYVQRIWKGSPSKALVFTTIDSNGRASGQNFNAFNVKSTSNTLQAYCNKLSWSSWASTDKTFAVYGAMGFYYKDTSKTLDEINSMFAEIGTDIEFEFILETPIETDLTEEEIARYKATHTNYPNTTIINYANAYTEVGYVADTKLYIDNKFKELTSAMAQLL